jgi:hypothetical protein
MMTYEQTLTYYLDCGHGDSELDELIQLQDVDQSTDLVEEVGLSDRVDLISSIFDKTPDQVLWDLWNLTHPK